MSPGPRRAEFVALIAMMFATIAFSIDAMLPALPDIGAALSPGNLNAAQLVITSFVLGMGLGTLFMGPLSDAFGRKRVILVSVAVYMSGAVLAALAQRLDLLLAARLVQGLGAAGPRVVSLAIVRDLYAGRAMAQITSFVMIVFTLVPALAPSLGAVLIAVAGWRSVFVAFIGFALIAAIWLALRLPESLPASLRRPLRAPMLRAAMADLLSHRTVRVAILVQALCFGMLFAFLSSTQQIFDVTFDQGARFHLWFGGIALVAASASFLNAALVMKLGMRVLITAMLTVQVGLSTAMILLMLWGLSGTPLFVAFLVWKTSVFFQAGMTIGNLNALAMEPVGHIAGLAASVIGSVATVLAVMIAVPIGLAFDGTPLPLAAGILTCTVLALIGMRAIARIEKDAVQAG